MKETLKGALFIIAAMLIFGFMGIFVRFLNLPSQTILFFSFLFSGIILFVIFFFKDKSIIFIEGSWKFLFLLVIVNLFNNFFYFQAFINTTISNAVLTHYTAPIFVALLAPFFLKEKIEKITIYSLLVAIIGMLFIAYSDLSLGLSELKGIAYGTASGLMYGLVIITTKHLSNRLSPFSITMYQSFFIALLLSPFVFHTDNNLTSSKIALLLLFAVLFGITATLFIIAGIKRIKSQHVGILAYVEPIAASFYAFILLSEIPGSSTIIGGAFILFSGYLILRRKK